MGRQPAVVIIARHGARLDQANRDWVNTAEKPWDPPLSYGGWIQCQTLGIRISNELHGLDAKIPSSTDGHSNKNGSDGNTEVASRDMRPKKKRKIFIHTSPYLRCVQTSCAIAAGLQNSQNNVRIAATRPTQPSARATAPQDDQTAGVNPGPSERGPTDASSPPEDLKKQHTNRFAHCNLKLRIDPFLGEWLSPSYFEHGPSPPPSAELVLEAKESLGKPQEEIKGADLAPALAFEVHVGDREERGDGSIPRTPQEKTGLRAMAAVGHSLPNRPRNTSVGTDPAHEARLPIHKIQSRPIGYTPPAPTYAMAPSDKIPPGFVAHARDACVDIDWSWDSLHEPLAWGDGGPFNEEWGNMHRRFRTGFQKLITYYETQATEPGCEEGEEDDEDTVLILVTHQAGCNALIRLLTGAPALHDIATSSITMAVRKQNSPRPADYKDKPKDVAPPPLLRRGSLDLTISEDYEMKIIASTEHLRAGSNPLGLNSPRLGKSPAFASRRAVGADSPEGFALGESLFSARGSTSLMTTRSSSQRSHAATESEIPTGLWRRGSRYSRGESESSVSTPLTISTRAGDAEEAVVVDEEMWNGPKVADKHDQHLLPVRSASQRQGALWGGADRARSPGKRRWTAVERSP